MPQNSLSGPRRASLSASKPKPIDIPPEPLKFIRDYSKTFLSHGPLEDGNSLGEHIQDSDTGKDPS
jgi:hypothetical protein